MRRSPKARATIQPLTTSTGTRSRGALPAACGPVLAAPGLPAANQSRHAACSMSANASPSGLLVPSLPTLSGLVTGLSQPSDVKCGVFANAFDDDGAALLPAKRAVRVRSACGTNLLLPVRSASR
jgi:hypothetical protein